jgi:hypothetical protein
LGRTNKSINKNPSERAVNARDIVPALYRTLEGMNGEAPSRNFGRDGKQAKSRLATHSAEQILAKLESFPDYWRSADCGEAVRDRPDFWVLFDEIPAARNRSVRHATPLNKLAEMERGKR